MRRTMAGVVLGVVFMLAMAGTAAAEPDGGAAVAAGSQAAQPPFYGLYIWCSAFAESPWLVDRVKELNFGIVSSQFPEGDAEVTERGMLICARNGIQVAGMVGPNSRAKTMDLDGWRQEIKTKVERYGPGGSFWKEHPEVPANPCRYWCITSEPGTELKPPGDMMPDECYFKFLEAAHDVLKRYNKDIQIVAMSPIGGYVAPRMDYVNKQSKHMGPRSFTEGVHKLGGAKLYDVYDMHAFTFPMPPDTGGNKAIVEWLNQETGKYGPAKPIWFLDWGFPTAYGLEKPFHVTHDQSADYAVRGFMLAAAHGVQTITYTYYHDQFSTTGQQGKGYRFKGYGIFTQGGELRVQARAIKLMTGLIPDRPKLLETISDGANPSPAPALSSDRPYTDSPFYCYKFQGVGDDEVIVAWTEGRPFKYALKVKGDKVALYNRELLGGIVYSKENGSISDANEIVLPITGTPLFVSTKVTTEQEKATVDYLRPAKHQDWKPIEGAPQ